MSPTKQWRPEIRRHRRQRQPAVVHMTHSAASADTASAAAAGMSRLAMRPVILVVGEFVAIGRPDL